MESNNVPKGFEKFKIFRDLITDIALLIKNLEQNLKIKLNQNKPSNSSFKDDLAKSALGSRIKKIWPFKGFSEDCRPSLYDYLDHNNNINKFLDEIVLENTGRINLIEQYDQIADIINKFKIDASGIFRKYSQQLQPEYDRERENFIKNTGIPDPVSDKEIEDAHKKKNKEIDSTDDKQSGINKETTPENEELIIDLIKKDFDFYFPNNEEEKKQIEKLKIEIDDEKLNELFLIYSPKLIKGGKEEIVNVLLQEIKKEKNNKEEIKKYLSLFLNKTFDWPNPEDLVRKRQKTCLQ